MAKEIPEEDGVLEEDVVNSNDKQVDDIPAYEEPTKDIPIQSVLVFSICIPFLLFI